MAAPEGKHMFGVVTVGERGQIVIPKKARELFGIKPGDSLMVLGDENGPFPGIAVVKNDIFSNIVGQILGGQNPTENEKGVAEDVRKAQQKDI